MKDMGWFKIFDNIGCKVSVDDVVEEFCIDMFKFFLGFRFVYGLYSKLYYGKYEDKVVVVKFIIVFDDDENGCLGVWLEK